MFISIVVLAGAFVGVCGCVRENDVGSTSDSVRVIVPMGRSTNEISGWEVPKEVNERAIRFFQITRPSVVTVCLLDGREMKLTVKTAFVNTDSGTTVDVDLLPLMQSVPYARAVEELNRCMREMDIVPDERMLRRMAEWPAGDVPGFDPVNRPGFYPHSYRAGMKLADDLDFDVKLRAADDDGWFFVLTFAVSGDTRRRIAGLPPARPSTQPQTQPIDDR